LYHIGSAPVAASSMSNKPVCDGFRRGLWVAASSLPCRYQSINQSIFISGVWPIKLEKTDREYLQQVYVYKSKPSLPTTITTKPTALALELVYEGVCYYAIQLFNNQLTENLVDTGG